MTDPRYIIGVDVGGTFTDVLCLEVATHELKSAKVPSLPGSQWRGVLNALAELGIVYGAIDAFVHGTTIATNTLLERKGAKTALITTEGFRDTLGNIGRQNKLPPRPLEHLLIGGRQSNHDTPAPKSFAPRRRRRFVDRAVLRQYDAEA